MAEAQMPNSTNEVTKNDAGIPAQMNLKPGDPGYSGNTLAEQAARQGKPTIKASLPSQEQPKEEEKSLGKKIFGVFFPGDMKTAGKYVKEKILGPDLAQLAFKMFTNMLSMLLFEKPTNGSPAANTTPTSTNQNGTVYKHYSTISNTPQATVTAQPFDVKKIEFESQDDIIQLVSILNEVMRENGKVSLADLVEHCDIPSTVRMEQCGWYNIRAYSTYQDNNGKWHLEMPNVVWFRNY